jgi:hypothetical protein
MMFPGNMAMLAGMVACGDAELVSGEIWQVLRKADSLRNDKPRKQKQILRFAQDDK